MHLIHYLYIMSFNAHKDVMRLVSLSLLSMIINNDQLLIIIILHMKELKA